MHVFYGEMHTNRMEGREGLENVVLVHSRKKAGGVFFFELSE